MGKNRLKKKFLMVLVATVMSISTAFSQSIASDMLQSGAQTRKDFTNMGKTDSIEIIAIIAAIIVAVIIGIVVGKWLNKRKTN